MIRLDTKIAESDSYVYDIIIRHNSIVRYRAKNVREIHCCNRAQGRIRLWGQFNDLSPIRLLVLAPIKHSKTIKPTSTVQYNGIIVNREWFHTSCFIDCPFNIRTPLFRSRVTHTIGFLWQCTHTKAKPFPHIDYANLSKRTFAQTSSYGTSNIQTGAITIPLY